MNLLKQLLTSRPAESAAASLGTAGLVTAIATGDWALVAAAVVGYVPAVVTYVDLHGGVLGVWHTLIHGQPKP